MTKTWRNWGTHYRTLIKAKDLNLAKIAERMDLAESTVRSWTNGTRELNLVDFVKLCEAAKLDPCRVLKYQEDEQFARVEAAWRSADERGRELLIIAATGAEEHAKQQKPRKNNSPPDRG